MATKFVLLASIVVSVALAQRTRSDFDFDFTLNSRAETTTPPVPILRFIDTQNPDGSYTYGFENGDGTYKIETRYVSGEVKGKYGYYDPTGKLREVEYGAAPDRGFEPRAEGLVVAPPTLVDESDYDYEVEPAVIEAPRRSQDSNQESRQFANFSPREGSGAEAAAAGRRRTVVRKRPIQDRRAQEPRRPRPQPQPVQQAARPRPQPVQQAARPRPQPRPQPRTFAVPQQQAQFLAVDPHRFAGHPAQNINLDTGTYTISYNG